jgi:hypothetical protein
MLIRRKARRRRVLLAARLHAEKARNGSPEFVLLATYDGRRYLELDAREVQRKYELVSASEEELTQLAGTTLRLNEAPDFKLREWQRGDRPRGSAGPAPVPAL